MLFDESRNFFFPIKNVLFGEKNKENGFFFSVRIFQNIEMDKKVYLFVLIYVIFLKIFLLSYNVWSDYIETGKYIPRTCNGGQELKYSITYEYYFSKQTLFQTSYQIENGKKPVFLIYPPLPEYWMFDFFTTNSQHKDWMNILLSHKNHSETFSCFVRNTENYLNPEDSNSLKPFGVTQKHEKIIVWFLLLFVSILIIFSPIVFFLLFICHKYFLSSS